MAGFADPSDYLKLPVELAASYSAGLAAVRTKLQAVGYIVSLVLSDMKDGATAEELVERTKVFIDSGSFADLPWFLRIPDQDVQLARDALRSQTVLDDVPSLLRELKNEGVEERSGRFFWTDKNFMFGRWEG